MPGAYTHLTLANRLKEPKILDNVAGFTDEVKLAVMTHFRFCELGAVSPDYPYLAFAEGGAAKWADDMHYTRTGEVIHAGIKRMQSMAEGVAKDKCLAWLLGYTSHFVADLTIHPVVFLKVGDYAAHKSEHRTCEMHQDACIFPTLNLGGIGVSEFLSSSIARCGKPSDRECLDPELKAFWEGILHDVYPDEYTANPPDIDRWHHYFISVVDGISDTSEHLAPFARHVGLHMDGLLYPAPDKVDRKFIDNLQTPDGVKNYRDIFKYTIDNTARIWGVVAQGIYGGSTNYLTAIGNWDLDTGKDKDNNFGFWG